MYSVKTVSTRRSGRAVSSRATRYAHRSARALLSVLLTIATLNAGTDAAVRPSRNLGDLSIEELLNETVTSVSRHEQKLADAAAAVFVVSNDDIRRSGATTIPDALRWVPGMDVASVNSRESAVSARGFNGVYSTKLLVMVDGRVVYTPLFAGVLWDLEQTPLEDVDRIEVIRGPGAAVWGANAVNGVINVATRSAKDTQGGWLYGGGGDLYESMAGLRYGGQVGTSTYYRVFASYQSNGDHPFANGQSANDQWRGRHAGFRVDHYPDADTQLTWQADGTDIDFDRGASDGYNGNTLVRWTRRLSDRASLEVQAYYDRTAHNEAARVNARFNTTDFTVQHNFGLGSRHDVIWGVGYRAISSKILQTNPAIQVRHGMIDLHLYSAFVQDEFHLVPEKLTLTSGVKLEHNDYTGYEVQPSLRLVFKPSARQTFWSAVSRAVRTPDEVEGKDAFGVTLGAPIAGPGGGLYLPTATGNIHPRAEVLWAYEVGYRIQATKKVSFDFAGFYNQYSRLITFGDVQHFIPGTPVGIAEVPAANLFQGHSYGGEASVTIAPSAILRLTAGYSYMIQGLNGPATASRELLVAPPRHQATLRVSYDFNKKLSVDAQVRYVSALESVPEYVTGDLHVSYRVNDHLEFSLVGQNLFDPQHPEQGLSSVTKVAEAPRSFYGKVTLRF